MIISGLLLSYPWPKAKNLEGTLNGEHGSKGLIKFCKDILILLRLAVVLWGPTVYTDIYIHIHEDDDGGVCWRSVYQSQKKQLSRTKQCKVLSI